MQRLKALETSLGEGRELVQRLELIGLQAGSASFSERASALRTENRFHKLQHAPALSSKGKSKEKGKSKDKKSRNAQLGGRPRRCAENCLEAARSKTSKWRKQATTKITHST
eukprot:781646-Amphidinium_carterae.1